jgi:hypothetical protein
LNLRSSAALDSEYERLVTGSNGFIPWSFMSRVSNLFGIGVNVFEPVARKRNNGQQYQAMILGILLLFHSMVTFDMTRDDVRSLYGHANSVVSRRRADSLHYREDWKDYNFVVHQNAIVLWELLRDALKKMHDFLWEHDEL